MKKVLSIAMCIAIMLSLVLEVYATTENDVSDTNSVSAEALPENIKNLIENYDEIESKSENIDLGENLYDMSIPKDDEQTEVSVFAVPIKYKKNNGDLAFIDTSFEKLGFTKRLLSKYDYKNTANEFDVLFSENAEDGFKMDEAFEMSVITEGKNNSDAEIDLDENKDGRLTYNNVYGDDTYIEYININSGVKENIVLEKNIGKNEFEFKWSSDTHILELSEDNTFINVVSKDTGEVDYVFSPLYVYDSYTTLKNKENTVENNKNNEISTKNIFAAHSSTLGDTTVEETTAKNEIVEDTTTEVFISDVNELATTQEVFKTNENTEIVLESKVDSTETSNTTESYDFETITTETTTTKSEIEVSAESTTVIAENQDTVENCITTNENTSVTESDTEIIVTEDINPDYVNKHNTEDCYYKITDNGNGNYIITAVISKDFLNSKETVYPVTIDPSVTASSSTSNIKDTYVYQASPDTNYGSLTFLRIGNNNGKMWSYIKFKTFPTITSGYIVGNAKLKLTFRPGQTTSATAKIGGITSKDWNSSAITWNSRIAWGGYNTTSSHHNCSYYEFDITNLVYDWYVGYCKNYGIVFTYKDQTYSDYNSVYSSEGATSGVPKLTITLIKCDINRDIYSNVNYDYSNYDRTVSSIYATNNRNSFSETHDTVGYLSTSQSIVNKTFGDKDDPVGDCTNFVSQCLKAGGMKEIEGSESSIKSWYYDVLLSKYYNASDTWGHAPSFCKHWGHTPNGEGIQSAYQTIIYHDFESALLDWDYILNTVKKGDVIQYYADSVGIFHSGIVFSVDKNARTIKYMQHSSTTSEAELNNRLRANVADEIIIHTF